MPQGTPYRGVWGAAQRLRCCRRVLVNGQRDTILHEGEQLVALVGNYGSGKTEIAVHLALQLADQGVAVQIADLDLVNPYFRCREAREVMEERGIRAVFPDESLVWADLPIVLPEVRGMLRPPPGTVSLFDVGGDDVGARVLASVGKGLEDGEYELWQVINAQRPFTRDVDGCLKMQREIEAASRWRVTGLVSNAHLMEETTLQTVIDGWSLTDEVARACGRPVRAVAVAAECVDDPRLRALDTPLLPLQRRMLPPCLQPERSHGTYRD